MRKLRLEKVGQCSRWHKTVVSELHFNLKFPSTAQCWHWLLFIPSPSSFSAAQPAQGCQAKRANMFKSLTSNERNWTWKGNWLWYFFPNWGSVREARLLPYFSTWWAALTCYSDERRAWGNLSFAPDTFLHPRILTLAFSGFAFSPSHATPCFLNI